MPLVVCQPCLWRGWSVAQRGVWPDGVVVDAPTLGQHTKFLDGVEDLRVEELIPELGVETLAVAVLPWRAGFDVQCFGARVCKPFAQVFRDELGAVVRAYVFRN